MAACTNTCSRKACRRSTGRASVLSIFHSRVGRPRHGRRRGAAGAQCVSCFQSHIARFAGVRSEAAGNTEWWTRWFLANRRGTRRIRKRGDRRHAACVLTACCRRLAGAGVESLPRLLSRDGDGSADGVDQAARICADVIQCRSWDARGNAGSAPWRGRIGLPSRYTC